VLGFFSFTEVTDPAAHRAYNEWHQLDHLPEQFSLEGILFGQRWVCSPQCQSARVAVSEDLRPCQYMTLYLMRDEKVIPGFMDLARQLREADRFFAHRRSHLSGPFGVTGRWAAPRIKVSAGVVPFRPSKGVYVVVGPPVDGAAMVDQEGVAGVWTFQDQAPDQASDQAPDQAPDQRRYITVAFVDGDLGAAATALGPWCLARGDGLEWAGPLEGIDADRWNWFDRLTPL
jgi:hypothetical protein